MNTESMSALQKLIHEGFVEGQKTALREGILDLLSVRFGEVPLTVKDSLQSGLYDRELDRVRGLAKSAKSLREFRQIAQK
jgi:hypothetical protein